MFPFWGISKDFKSRIWNRNLKSLHILIKKARKCEWFSSRNGVSFIQPVSTLFKSCFAPVKAGHKFTMCSRHQLLKTLLPFSTLNDPTSLLKVSSRNIAFTDLRNCFIPLFFQIKLLAFGTIRNYTFKGSQGNLKLFHTHLMAKIFHVCTQIRNSPVIPSIGVTSQEEPTNKS